MSKTKTAKLPVPPPKQAQANGDGLDIPESLKVENRVPLTPEQKAQVDAKMAAAKPRGLTSPPPKKNGDADAIREAIANGVGKRIEGNGKHQKVKPLLQAAKAKPEPIGKARKAARLRREAVDKATSKRTDEPRSGSKLAAIAKLLQRKDGCTRADVLKATGWPSVSMQQQARAAGLKLKMSKEKGEPTVYRAG
jgi:hypothetical protein